MYTPQVEHRPSELRPLGVGHNLVGDKVAVAIYCQAPLREQALASFAVVGYSYIVLRDILRPEL